MKIKLKSKNFSENNIEFSYSMEGLKLDRQCGGTRARLKNAIHNHQKVERISVSSKRKFLVEKANTILIRLSYSSTSARLGAGYIYAPYIPVQMTPTIIDDNNFQPNENIRTRYQMTQVNNENYGQVIVANVGA